MSSVTRLMTWMVFVTCVVAPVSACMFRVWVHHETVRLGYQLSAEERRGHELSEQVKQLEVELAAERSPGRLMQLARTLGLHAPQPSQVVGRNVSRGGRGG